MGIYFVVGNGRRIKSFPTLFAISDSKESWLEDILKQDGYLGLWCHRFSRQFNHWELEIRGSLFCERGWVQRPSQSMLSGTPCVLFRAFCFLPPLWEGI